MRVLGNLLNQDILVAAVRAGGWAISLASIDEVTGEYMSIEIVGVAGDDQALVEWFAEQLSLPAPTLPVADAVTLESLQAALARQHELILRAIPAAVSNTLPGPTPQPRADEAPAAAIVPPPVSAEIEDVERLQGYAVYMRDEPDDLIIKNYYDDALTPSYGALMLGDLRALLRAAGLFTDEMRPSQPPPAADASVKPAEVAATPPPADADGSDSCPHCGAGFFMPHQADCPSLKGDEGPL